MICLCILVLAIVASCYETSSLITQAPNLPVCQLGQYCHGQNFYWHVMISCEGFSSLSQLNTTYCEYHTAPNVPVDLQLVFPARSILSSGLSIILDVASISLNPNIGEFYLYLANLAGIDLNIFTELNNYNTGIVIKHSIFLYLATTELNFFYKNENLMKPDKCTSENYMFLLDENGANVLGKFIELNFYRMIVRQERKLCKYLFQNMTLNQFVISGSNMAFYPSEINSTRLGAYIYELTFQKVYRLVLDTNILQPDVFSQTKIMSLSACSLSTIQSDLFRHRFPNLTYIGLFLTNMKGLLHGKGGLDWVHGMNYDLIAINVTNAYLTNSNYLIEMLELYLITIEFSTFANNETVFSVDFFPYIDYQFPDQDICLFRTFPLEKLIFPRILRPANLSCTIKWLMQYQDMVPSPNYVYGLNSLQCNFTDLFRRCEIENKSMYYQTDPYFVLDDLRHSLSLAKQILNRYIGSSVSAFGFITNMFIVITILYNHKRRNEIRVQPKNKSQEIVMLDQPLYRYILFNSIINSLFLLMYLLDYSINCTPINMAINLGYLRNCFFNNLILDVFGSFLKLLSNFSFLQISLNRFLLVGKDHSERLVKIANMTLRRFFIYTSITSALISIIVYFQREFFVVKTKNNDNTYYFYSNSYYNFYFWGWTNKLENMNSVISKLSELPLLTAVTVVHNLFAYFLFCLVSVIIDALTVKRLHDALLEKAKLKGNQERKKNRESERKSIMMVVLSSLTNIIFRAPELISLIFYYIVTHNGHYVFKMLCWTYQSCLVFVDYANVFYIMSLCFNLFFYIKFNSIFKCSFDVLTDKLLVKIRLKKKVA